jgi:hypothetical protein
VPLKYGGLLGWSRITREIGDDYEGAVFRDMTPYSLIGR